MSIYYHPRKVNVVVDAHSRLSMGSVSQYDDGKKELVRYVHYLARLDMKLTLVMVEFMCKMGLSHTWWRM